MGDWLDAEFVNFTIYLIVAVSTTTVEDSDNIANLVESNILKVFNWFMKTISYYQLDEIKCTN